MLAGGRTPRPAYEHTARDPAAWHAATVWFGDERCVSPKDERSNYRMVQPALLNRLDAACWPDVQRIRAELGPREASDDYERRLRDAGPGRFDLVLLGLGPDGHTASLFPDQHALGERERLVVGVEHPARAPFVPRVTLTLPTLASTGRVVFLRHRIREGRGGRRGVRPSRSPRSTRSRLDAAVAGRRSRGAARSRGGVTAMTEVVGVDLGGTKVAVARLRDGGLGDSLVEPTNRSSATALVDQLDALVERARSEATSAVGIGVPSVVEFETGRVVSVGQRAARGPAVAPAARRPARRAGVHRQRRDRRGARGGARRATATGRPRPGDAHNRNRRRRRARARRPDLPWRGRWRGRARSHDRRPRGLGPGGSRADGVPAAWIARVLRRRPRARPACCAGRRASSGVGARPPAGGRQALPRRGRSAGGSRSGCRGRGRDLGRGRRDRRRQCDQYLRP